MTSQNIEDILRKDGVYVSTTSGVSMYPLLRDRRDTVVITPCTDALKKYDIALFRRGEKYVLHRVIKTLPDSYVIRGDNCIIREHVRSEDVIGRLTELHRGNKKLKLDGGLYKAYSVFIVFFHPIVALKLKLKSRFRKGGR